MYTLRGKIQLRQLDGFCYLEDVKLELILIFFFNMEIVVLLCSWVVVVFDCFSTKRHWDGSMEVHLLLNFFSTYSH